MKTVEFVNGESVDLDKRFLWNGNINVIKVSSRGNNGG